MKDFTTGSVPRHLMKFLVPLLLTNMLQAAYMLIDAFWAGRLLGPAGVAIVSTGTPVIFFLSSLLAGVFIGGSILAGQAYGARNMAMLSNIISSSFLATLGFSVLLSAFGIALTWPILRIIHTPAPLMAGSHVFLVIITGGMVFSVLVQWFASILNAAGDSRTPSLVLVLSLALNTVLAPLLIRGWHGIPAMGIAGSAVSTVISNILGVIVCIFVWKRHRLFENAPLRIELHGDTVRRILAVGFPLSLQLVIVSSSFLFVLALVNEFGAATTAAFGIGSRIDQFAFMASFAVATAVSAMTAQHVGAGKFERIGSITRWGLIVALVMALPFALAVIAFPDRLIAVFTQEPMVVNMARSYFRIIGLSYAAFAVMFAFMGVLRGAGDTVASFLIIACTMVFFRVPLCFALSRIPWLGRDGIWLGMAATTFAGALIFYVYYVSGKWKNRGKLARTQASELELEVPIVMHD